MAFTPAQAHTILNRLPDAGGTPIDIRIAGQILGFMPFSITTNQSIGGALTPTGALEAAIIIFQSVGGKLTMIGSLIASNPAWLLIDKKLVWQGEWSASRAYEIEDVVLYQTSADTQWHVFVSKIGHNVGNIPTSTAAAWRRLYQEKWL